MDMGFYNLKLDGAMGLKKNLYEYENDNQKR